jgi:hypothetical protein
MICLLLLQIVAVYFSGVEPVRPPQDGADPKAGHRDQFKCETSAPLWLIAVGEWRYWRRSGIAVALPRVRICRFLQRVEIMPRQHQPMLF